MQLAELQPNKDKTAVSPSPSTPLTLPLTPSPGPAPGVPVSSGTPTATADGDVPSLNSAAASSRSYPLLIRLDARSLGSNAVPVVEQSAQGGSLDFAASAAWPLRLQAPTSEVMCQTPRRWPRQPPVPGRPRDVPVPPVRQGADVHAASAPVPPAYPAPVPASASAPVGMRGGLPRKSSSVTSGRSRRDAQLECTWTCLRDCGFERSSYAAVAAHEQRCQAPVHPTEQAPSAGPGLQAEQHSSDYGAAPESDGSSTAVGSPRASTRRPDHAARIRGVLQARLVAQLLHSSVRRRVFCVG